MALLPSWLRCGYRQRKDKDQSYSESNLYISTGVIWIGKACIATLSHRTQPRLIQTQMRFDHVIIVSFLLTQCYACAYGPNK